MNGDLIRIFKALIAMVIVLKFNFTFLITYFLTDVFTYILTFYLVLLFRIYLTLN